MKNVDIDRMLKEILVRNMALDVPISAIHENSDLINDFAIDSIIIVNLFAEFEEQFAIEIRVEDISEPILGSYRSLKEFIGNKVTERNSEEWV